MVQLRPQAQTVDLYARPQRQGENSLHRLAKGLRGVHRGIGVLADAHAQRKDYLQNQQKYKALREELKDTKSQRAVAMGKAVRSGQIPLEANPYFQAGMRDGQQVGLAQKYRKHLAEAYAADKSIQLEEDRNKVDGWIHGQFASWSEENLNPEDREFQTNPGLLDKFNEVAELAHSETKEQHINGMMKRFRVQEREAQIGRIRSILTTATSEYPGDRLAEIMQGRFVAGVEGRHVVLDALEGVDAAAHERRDPDFYQKFVSSLSGQRDSILKDLSKKEREEFTQKVQEAEDKFWDAEIDRVEEEERKMDEDQQAIYQSSLDTLIQGGSPPDGVDSILPSGMQGMLSNVKDAMQSPSPPKEDHRFYAEFFMPGQGDDQTQSGIYALLGNGLIPPEQAARSLTMLKMSEEHKAKGVGVHDTLFKRLVAAPLSAHVQDLDPEASSEMLREVFRWAEENPEATMGDRKKFYEGLWQTAYAELSQKEFESEDRQAEDLIRSALQEQAGSWSPEYGNMPDLASVAELKANPSPQNREAFDQEFGLGASAKTIMDDLHSVVKRMRTNDTSTAKGGAPETH